VVTTGTRVRVDLCTLDRSHLDTIATIHRAAFPRSALTTLGHQAVRRYYAWQLDGPHESYTIGALCDGELAGFCFGGIFPEAISGYVRKNAPFLLSRVLVHPELIADPAFRRKLDATVRKLRTWPGKRSAKRPEPAKPAMKWPFDILAIAVHPNLQDAGLGTRIMQQAERIARERDFHYMTLVVNPSNTQAIRFYEKIGWERALVRGEWRGNMIRWLTARP
jgi:ribosomal protein S18 acetylase RimI-like enzyme